MSAQQLIEQVRSGSIDTFDVIPQLADSQEFCAIDFLIGVLADEKVDDVTRIEVIRWLPLRNDDATVRQRLGKALIAILGSSCDVTVRQYASKRLRQFIDVEGVVAAASAACSNPIENTEVKAACFSALAAHLDRSDCLFAVQQLAEVDFFRNAVIRALGNSKR